MFKVIGYVAFLALVMHILYGCAAPLLAVEGVAMLVRMAIEADRICSQPPDHCKGEADAAGSRTYKTD